MFIILKILFINKQTIVHRTVMKYPAECGNLLQHWNINCDDKINRGKTSIFINLSASVTPAGCTRATGVPPIDDSFMYTETNSNVSGPKVYCSFERSDNIQTIKITFLGILEPH